MGALSKTLRSAKNFVGKSWGHTKKLLHGAKETLDAGVSIYSKLQPVLSGAAQAFGNKQVKGFASKARQDVESGIKRGQSFASEISSNVDKIDRLGGEFMNAFR